MRRLQGNSKFDLSLDWLSFSHSLQIAILTKEPEMLQSVGFCEHTMQQNATATGVPTWTPPGNLYGSLCSLVVPVLMGPLSGGRKGRGTRNQLPCPVLHLLVMFNIIFFTHFCTRQI